jgi:hypothetical protein
MSGLPDSQPIAIGPDLVGRVRWRIQLVGYVAHNPVIDAVGGSVYLTDGWGPGSNLALKYRRYDLATGREMATVRLGDLVRCLTFSDDRASLLVATGAKIHRLDPLTLKRAECWERRIPRYASSLVARGSHVALANPMKPTLGFIDLSSGLVRTRRTKEMTQLIEARPGPLAVSGRGGLSAVDPAAAAVTPLLETPPVQRAAATSDGAVWLTVGLPVLYEQLQGGASIGPPPPGCELRRYDLTGSRPPLAYTLPLPALSVACGQSGVWLSNGPRPPTERQHVLLLRPREGGEPAAVWRAPERHVVLAMAPDAGVALTVCPHSAEVDADVLFCYELSG